MKKQYLIVLTVVLLCSVFGARAAEDLTVMRIKTELTNVMLRFLSQNEFIINVAGDYNRETRRELIEKEVVREKAATTKTEQPKQLPGFRLPPPAPENVPSEYSKETFKESEREVLNRLNVQIFVDEKVGYEELERVRLAVKSFLTNQVFVKHTLAFTPIAIKEILNEKPSVLEQPWWVWILIALLVIVILGLLTWAIIAAVNARARKRQALASHAEGAPGTLSPEGVPLSPSAASMEQGKLDNNTRVRALMIDRIIANPEAFKGYFDASTNENKEALVSLLAGPAMENVFDTLNMDVSKWSEKASSNEEINANALNESYTEFLKTYEWERAQFFGYLGHSDRRKITTLFYEDDPLSSAVVGRFLDPVEFAKILAILPPEKRFAILSKSAQAASLPFNDVAKIEEEVRIKLDKMPGVGEQLSKGTFETLKEIFINSDDQDKMLADLQKAAPEYYEELAKLRFKLEDIPGLPTELISKVVSRLDNHELALGMVGLPGDIVDAMLDQTPANRRSLIVSQMSTLGEVSPEERRQARLKLASEFRKEI
jgi:flagellar motor switch protein FliG